MSMHAHRKSEMEEVYTITRPERLQDAWDLTLTPEEHVQTLQQDLQTFLNEVSARIDAYIVIAQITRSWIRMLPLVYVTRLGLRAGGGGGGSSCVAIR